MNPPQKAAGSVRHADHSARSAGMGAHPHGPHLRTQVYSSVASSVMSARSTLDTGQPALALAAISWNFASSVPGIFALSTSLMAGIEKPP